MNHSKLKSELSNKKEMKLLYLLYVPVNALVPFYQTAAESAAVLQKAFLNMHLQLLKSTARWQA